MADFVESPAAKKARMKSLGVILFTNFLSAAGFSLLLPSMWQYYESMGGTTAKLGVLVGAFSVGQLFGAPFWGFYSTKRGYAETFYLTILTRMAGNVMYAYVCIMPLSTDNLYYALIGSRILVGFGAGSMAVCSAYVSGATTLMERLKWMGFAAGTGGLGFIFGPLVGSAFGGMPDYEWPFLRLNFMTAPPLFASFLCIVNMLIIFCRFQETIISDPKPKEKKKKKRAQQGVAIRQTGSVQYEREDRPLIDEEAANTKPKIDVAKTRDYIAVTAILAVYFFQYCLFSVFETIGLPLMEDEYGWTAKHADVISGIVSGVFGFQSVVMFLCTQLVAKRIGHRPTLMIGLFLAFMSQLLSIPWAGKAPDNKICKYTWCTEGHELPLPQYIFSLFIVYIGFPLANVMLFTIYSKILGPAPQGTWMGLINACGSLARTVGPIAISNAYAYGGLLYTYGLSTGFVGIALCIVICLRHRFIAYGTRQQGLKPSIYEDE